MKYSDLIMHEKWDQFGTDIIYPEKDQMICELSQPLTPGGYVEHVPLSPQDPRWEVCLSRGRLIRYAPQMFKILSLATAKGLSIADRKGILNEALELIQHIQDECYDVPEDGGAI